MEKAEEVPAEEEEETEEEEIEEGSDMSVNQSLKRVCYP